MQTLNLMRHMLLHNLVVVRLALLDILKVKTNGSVNIRVRLQLANRVQQVRRSYAVT